VSGDRADSEAGLFTISAFILLAMAKEGRTAPQGGATVDPLPRRQSSRLFAARDKIVGRLPRGRIGAVLLVDWIFKMINDNFGHRSGRQSLRLFVPGSSDAARDDMWRLGKNSRSCSLTSAERAVIRRQIRWLC